VIRNLAIGIFAVMAVSLIWYISYPMIFSVIQESENTTISFGVNTSASASLYALLKFLAAIWGVALDLGLIGFLLISVHQREWESKYR